MDNQAKRASVVNKAAVRSRAVARAGDCAAGCDHTAGASVRAGDCAVGCDHTAGAGLRAVASARAYVGVAGFAILSLLALSVLLGCLGLGGGDGSGVGVPVGPSDAVLSGRVFFPENSRYGGIPVSVRDLTGKIVASTRTDAVGNFSFAQLPAGQFDLLATTGEAETVFQQALQITSLSHLAVPTTALLNATMARIDQISSQSLRVSFTSGQPAVARLEYAHVTENPHLVDVSTSWATDHQVVLSDLSALTRYGITLHLYGEDGQQFSFPGLLTTTTGASGPGQLEISIAEGRSETRNRTVQLRLRASGATHMRLGESEDLSDADWEIYTPHRSWLFASGQDGTRRLFVQFKDAQGDVSSVIHDSILLSTSASGYLGVWINKGDPLTADTDVILSLLYPGATEMLLSSRADFFNAYWETYTERHAWKLEEGDGEKTVFARFRGGSADSEQIFTAGIILDTASASGTPTIRLNRGDQTTTRSTVFVEVQNADAYSVMRLSENGNFFDIDDIPVAPVNYSFQNREAGEKTVHAQFQHSTTGEFHVTTGIITLVGPQEPTLTTDDQQPLLSNFVKLSLFALDAVQMLVSEDIASMSKYTDGDWRPFQNQLSFPLKSGGGEHKIYAKYRNSMTEWVETLPLTLQVTVNDTPPSANTASIRESPLSGSPEVTIITQASLPAYIHFDIQDAATASISWTIVKITDPVPTQFRYSSAVPAPPIQLNQGDFPGGGVGVFGVYYRFATAMGLQSPVQLKTIEILGPELLISPRFSGPFRSGATQQYVATLKSLTGTVRWTLMHGGDAGSINVTTGLYSAPALVERPTVATIVLDLVEQPTYRDELGIILETQVEILLSSTESTISLNKSKGFNVVFKNSHAAGLLAFAPGSGDATAELTNVQTIGDDTVASISLHGPSTMPEGNPLILTVTSLQDPARQKSISITVQAGESISLTPSSANIRLRTGSLGFTADPTTVPTTVYWKTTNGWFDPARTIKTATTEVPHNLVYFAPLEGSADTIVASFTDGPPAVYTTTAIITLTPSVEVNLLPLAGTMSIASTTTITFSAVVENATTPAVLWSYRVADGPSGWTPIDAVNPDGAGILMANGNDAIYSTPGSFPGGQTGSNTVLVRAISIDDPVASRTAVITLIPPIVTKIGQQSGNDFTDWTGSHTSVLLEIDTKQWVASVSNTLNTAVTWYVQDIPGGNEIYGTISPTGLYQAPAAKPSPEVVTIKCVSVADSGKSAAVSVTLKEFWQKRSHGLQMNNGTDMPVFSLLVDPIWPTSTTSYVLLAGTNGNGVWFSQIDSSPASFAPDFTWTPTAIANTKVNILNPGRFVINDMAINPRNHDIAAATGEGVFIIRATTVDPRMYETFQQITATQSSALAWDSNDPRFMYFSHESGIMRYVFVNADPGTGDYVKDEGRTQYLRLGYHYATEERVFAEGSPTVDVTYTAYYPTSLLFDVPITALGLSRADPQVLYFGSSGGHFGKISNIRDTATPIDLDRGPPSGIFPGPHARRFIFATGSDTAAVQAGIPRLNPDVLNPPLPLHTDKGYIVDIAIDPNSYWTLLLGSSDGLFRSTDQGGSFAPLAAGVNTRAVLIDPTNLIYFFYGAEDGLYRSKDAGVTWTRINTGLGGQKTINTFTQSYGPPGTKRRIWVGTTGGVFMDGRSLDLE